jgi:twinkle protein
VQHEPCPSCGSKDNLARYSDGTGWCFGCGRYDRGDGTPDRENEEDVGERIPGGFIEGAFKALPVRALTEETCRKYGYRTESVPKAMQVADYYDARGVRVAQKIRYADKSFNWIGDPKAAALFGQHLWAPGRRVTITEGEVDALSLAQAQGLRWPVVSVKNGASGAAKEVAAQLQWLEEFEEVVLCFDNDEPGQKAARDCAEMLSPGKARIAHLPLKDANDMLVAGRTKELVSAIWEATPFRPDGIISGVELIERVLAPPPPSIEYPWPCLMPILRGQRRCEITTWCGGTGGGKSQVVREIAHALHQRGEGVGIIALEESVERAALAQVSLALGKRLHDQDVRAAYTDDEIRAAAATALKGMHFHEHFGSISVEALRPKIRYMARALGVQWVILDHISIMVSGTATEGDERKRLDELMTALRTLTQELGIGMHIVSHLRKASGTPHEEGGRVTMDDLRGSGAIKQISDNIIGLERNQQAEDRIEKNTTTVRVLKCRLFGDTGIAGRLQYVPETGRIIEVDGAAFDDNEQRDDGEGF